MPLELTEEEARRYRQRGRVTHGPFGAFVWRGHLFAFTVLVGPHDGPHRCGAVCRACSWYVEEAELLPEAHCSAQRP